MTCREFQNQNPLLLYDEASETLGPELETHLAQCEECRRAYEEAKGLHGVLCEDAAAWELPAELLIESRRSLADELDRIERKRAWWRLPSFSAVLSPMRLLESAAFISMGLALGVYVTNSQVARQVAANHQQPETVSAIPANGSVANLRIVSADPNTGEVELAGEVVQPLRLQGKVIDDTVRQLLFNALRDGSNPGSRLRAAEILSPAATDQNVKEALIQSMLYDDNPGVRRKALESLKPFASQEDVRAALMNVLGNESNPGIKIEAIETLGHGKGNPSLNKTMEKLAKGEDNAYVQMKMLQFVGNNR